MNQFNYACPECKDTSQINVAAIVWVRLTSDGTDTDAASDGSHEWDNTSSAQCEACGWAGKVADLIELEEEETDG